MNEHAESRFVPPLHAASAVGIFRGGVLRLGLRGRGSCFVGGGQRDERCSGAKQPVAPRDAIRLHELASSSLYLLQTQTSMGLWFQLENSFHEQPLLAWLCLREGLLEFPHQFLPFADFGTCTVCFGFGGE